MLPSETTLFAYLCTAALAVHLRMHSTLVLCSKCHECHWLTVAGGTFQASFCYVCCAAPACVLSDVLAMNEQCRTCWTEQLSTNLQFCMSYTPNLSTSLASYIQNVQVHGTEQDKQSPLIHAQLANPPVNIWKAKQFCRC